MANQTTNYRVTVNSDTVASVHEDGIVIIHTLSGLLFASNQTGAHIWRCIEQQLPFDDIVAQIGNEYRIARLTAREHTARFLMELERNNLVNRGAAL